MRTAVAAEPSPRPAGQNGQASGSRRTARPRASASLSSRWLLGFVVFEFACQLALLFPSVGPRRTAVRVGSFGASLVLLFMLRGVREKHPAWPLAAIIIAILGRLSLEPGDQRTARGRGNHSAGTGDPRPDLLGPGDSRGRRDASPAVPPAVAVQHGQHDRRRAAGLLSRAVPASANAGSERRRPSGSSSTSRWPVGRESLARWGSRMFRGGAGVGAAYTVLLATGFLLARPGAIFRAILVASIVMACFTLYLTQIRSIVVMLAISLLAMVAVSSFHRRGRTTLDRTGRARRGWRRPRDGTLDRWCKCVRPPLHALRFRIQGASTTRIEDCSSNIRSSICLPQYPLGAGLGRWGMISAYFGDNSNRPIWAEIQWTGRWLLGRRSSAGTIVYPLAFTGALAVTARICTTGGHGEQRARSPGRLRWWGTASEPSLSPSARRRSPRPEGWISGCSMPLSLPRASREWRLLGSGK